MNNVLKKNLYLIEKYYPNLLSKLQSIKPSGSIKFEAQPTPYLTYKNVSIHPTKESNNLILKQLESLRVEEGIIYLFMGIGLGYQIEEFFRIYAKQCEKVRIIIIEKNPEIFFHFIKIKDISFLLKPFVTLLVGENIKTIEKVFETISVISFKGYRIIKHPVLYDLDIDYYEDVEISFKSILGSGLADLFTRRFLEPLWIKNIILNIPFLARAKPLITFKRKFTGVPAIIAGAGPSLKADIENLRDLSNDVSIIATDTALRALLASGITPHFVITLDAQYPSIMDFQPPPIYSKIRKHNSPKTTKPILIADLSCYPGVLKLGFEDIYIIKSLNISQGNKHIAYEVSSIYEYLRRYTDKIEGLICGGSVFTTAIEFALHAGFYPIVLCGADFSYHDYQTHVVSSPYYRKSILETKRTSTLLNYNVNYMMGRKLLLINNSSNHPVYSDVVLKKYLDWISQRRTKYHDMVFLSMNNTISFQGIEKLDLKKLKLKIYKRMPSFEDIKEKEIGSIYNTPLEILAGIKEKLIQASNWLKLNTLSEESLACFSKEFSFLNTITMVFFRFYKKPKIITSQMESFVITCIKTAEKSIKIATR